MTLRQDEFIAECSDIDFAIIFRKDGTYVVKQIEDKFYIGENVIYIDVWKKDDKRTIYNTIYFDGKSGYYYMKRFNVKSIIKDREYNLTKGEKGSKIMWFTANPNGEAEIVKITHRPRKRLKNKVLEIDFSELAIKGRNSQGNIATKYGVSKIVLKEEGISTLGGRKIWFDQEVLRLNPDGRGEFLGEFKANDKILVIYENGVFNIKTYELSNHFDLGILKIEKFEINKIWTAVFYEAEQKFNYLKRFKFEDVEEATIIGEHKDSKLLLISDFTKPQFEIEFGGKNKDRENEIIDAEEFISEKSYKARGKRLTTYLVKKIIELEPKIEQEIEDATKTDKNQSDTKDKNEDLEFEVIKTDDKGNQTKLDL